MRVLFDVTGMQIPSSQGRGIGGYVRNLYRELAVGDQCEVRTLGFPREVPDLGGEGPDVHIGPGPQSSLELTALSLALHRSPRWPREMGVHFTSLSAVGAHRGLDRNYVATVFDLIPLMWPDQYLGTWRAQCFYKAYLKHLREAARLVAISGTVADYVAERLEYPRDRITTTPLGVPPLPVPESVSPREKPYVFLAGTPDPHKNAWFAIRAVSIVPPSVRPTVIMTGATPGDTSEMALRSRALGVTLEHLGRVPAALLSTLYHHAAAVLVPSLYEGFGLQALEALSVGARVAVSPGGALPEVVGDAALVLPFDMDLWADAVTTAVMGDWPIDAHRGPDRASEFTWRRTAEKTIDAYRRVWDG